MKQSGRTPATIAFSCALGALTAIAACGDRAVVVGDWVITRRAPDAGSVDAASAEPFDATATDLAPPLPPPAMSACVEAAAMPERPVTLAADELARRLAWYLWRTPADAALIQQAAGIVSTTQVRAMAETMLNDPRSRGGTDALARDWLKSDSILTANARPEVASLLTTELRQSMAAEPRLFLHELISDRRSTTTTLLTAPYTFADQRLAALYGVPAPMTGFAVAPLDSNQRAGLLTQLGFLTARPHGPSRGGWLYGAILCQVLPPPPDLSDSGLLPVVGAGESYRFAFARAVKSPVCTVCHAFTEVGFTLDHFDALGRYRTQDNGMAIDASARLMVGSSNDVTPVTGGPALGQELAQRCEVNMCLARSFLTYGAGRFLEDSDTPDVRALAAAFGQAGFKLSDLFLGVVQTATFLKP